MKLTIDRSACTGHGRCYSVAPDLCEPNDDGYGVIMQAAVAPELESQAHAAVANRPERAVALVTGA